MSARTPNAVPTAMAVVWLFFLSSLSCEPPFPPLPPGLFGSLVDVGDTPEPEGEGIEPVGKSEGRGRVWVGVEVDGGGL